MKKSLIAIGIVAMLLLATLPLAAASSSNVRRFLPSGDQAAGSTITVYLNVTVDPVTSTYYAIDEFVPAGWIITDASDDGDYTSDPGHVRWVVINGAVDKTYSYRVLVPGDAGGAHFFTGIFQMEGMEDSAAIGCDTRVRLGELAEDVPLSVGWNFVSVSYTLADPGFSYVIRDLPVDAVLGYDAINRTWEHSMDLVWMPRKEYWVHATEACFIPAERLAKAPLSNSGKKQ
ncbi:MAG: hypothetical protein PHW56_08740 [Methanosarcinaceae archaeon]|nr:hypothetical protein [Methanosarcinaceae archaeon]